jgi:phosphodiesterase/alkaline phosphatase D-like protein
LSNSKNFIKLFAQIIAKKKEIFYTPWGRHNSQCKINNNLRHINLNKDIFKLPVTNIQEKPMKSKPLTQKFAILFAFIFLLSSAINIQGQAPGENNISSPMALPSSTTQAATPIAATTATLNGEVNANGEDATVTFEYSTDGNFPDDETPAPTVIAAIESPVAGGAGLTAVTANLTGLTPGTVYYFRVVAVNASGTTEGDIETFSTDPPATVTTGIASPVTTTTAQLNGTVNANSNSTTVTFEYGLTTSYGTTVTADQSPVTGTSDTAVSKSIGSLTPNTTYHFRVVGVNALGTSNGEDMTFFTSAQAAPTATTEDATYNDIGSPNTANLKGTVNANNADATVTFEYGLTTAYGTTVTADQSPVPGSTDTAVSKTISGLTADTTYHYRVVATNSQGTTNGADMTFYNTVAPYARTDAAIPIGLTTATLNGTVNPKRFDDSQDTTVTFDYGLTNAYGSSATAIQSPLSAGVEQMVSFELTGLTANTTYHYRVTATSPSGTGTGADMTFTTSSLPIVTTNSATPVGTTTATLNGEVNANGDSTTVTFEYGTTTSYGTTVTADQSPVTGTTDTAVSKGITGLSNGTTYHYRVVGTNSSGTSNGADMTFTTGLIPPTVTTNAATSVLTTTATLNATVNANNFNTTVSFEWGTDMVSTRLDPGSPGPVSGSSNTAVSLGLTGLDPNTTYYFRTVGQNAGGTVNGSWMNFTTAALPTVTTNIATPVTATTATLNGTVNANGDSTTVTFEYGLTTSYGTTVTADQSPVTGTTDTAVSKGITGLTGGQTYHYRVVGTNGSGTSNGADMTFTTTVSAPTATTDAATNVGGTTATFNGTVNANNASTTVTFEYGTTVAYGSTETADQSPVIGSNNTAVSFNVTGLANNTTYHYRVVAVNGSGTTNGSDMSFTTSSKPIATTGAATNVLDTSATLNGIVNNNNTITSTTVTFDYGLTAAYGTSVVGNPSIATGTSDTAATFDLTGLTPNTTYHYRVKGQSAFGTTNGADMTFTTPIGPTAATNAATSVGTTTAVLNGTVNANNASTTVTFEYGLDTFYGQTVFANESPVTGSTNTAVTNNLGSLVPNTTYHYRVVAQNANGTATGSDMTFTTGGAAPSVTTNSATAVGATGATMNGTVNANNDNTTVTFEYGTTAAYGTTVSYASNPVTGSSNTAVSFPLTGLATNTTFHYRVVGQNGSGTVNGADATFTTGIQLPTVTTASATSVSSAGAQVNGTVNANNDSTVVTFEIGLTTSYGLTEVADQSPVTGSTATAVSRDLTGLLPNTTYHYRVVGQNSAGTSNGADMTFFTNASGTATITTEPINSIAGTSARSGGIISSDGGFAITQRGVCWSTSPTPTIANSRTTNGSGTGTFTSNMTGLMELTTYYVRAYATNAAGTAYGQELMFTTNSATVSVAITNPDHGETVSGTVTISATASSARSNSGTSHTLAITRVEFYVDDALIYEDTTSPYEVSWDSNTVSDGSHTIKAVAYDSSSSSQDSITVTVSNAMPTIGFSPSELNFGAVVGSTTEMMDSFLITNSGTGTLNWTITDDASWLTTSPTAGTGSNSVDVTVDPTGLAVGTYTAYITVTDINATNNPVTIPVTLTIYGSGSSASPFGSFDTPINGATVMSSIPVTGWALDDIEVDRVEIYRAPVSGEGGSMIYIGDGVFIEGARPDVEVAYPTYPNNSKAGWGYMLLTNFLPNQGNGTFTLYAKAVDAEGHVTTLGSKTIFCDNANAVKPFGAIDTPTQGGDASGSAFVNFGWALTPLPNTIPTDGSTIKVYIDGVPQSGNPVYNQFRSDIATLFPGYNNANGAVGYYFLNTFNWPNGVHTIAWSVTDDANNVDGIGSRYFNIINGGTRSSDNNTTMDLPDELSMEKELLNQAPNRTPIKVKTGYNGTKEEIDLLPDQNGISQLTIKEIDHVQFRLAENIAFIEGYSRVNDRFTRLPIGSTLVKPSGTFYWSTGAGFLGNYTLIFIITDQDGNTYHKQVDITIEPKFNVIK